MNDIPPRAVLRVILLIACGLALPARALATDPDPSRFDAEIRAFESWDQKNAVPRDAILFVGSSSIRMWPTAQSYPDLPVINRGFGGSHIADVNHFAERIVLKYKPRSIVFYAGDNDIAAGKSPQQVADDFQTFVTHVHDRLPDARILYLPIKPSIARWKLWPQMQQANALVEQLAERDKKLRIVDTATPMLAADGKPREEIFLDDGLHMNEKGYQIWNEMLGPILQEQLSNRES